MQDNLDGAALSSSSPIPSSPPALAPIGKVGRIRSLLGVSSSSSEKPAEPPPRRRSVRFKDEVEGQLDGPQSNDDHIPRTRISTDSRRSRLSQSLSDHLENLSGKLNMTFGNDTIVHRRSLRTRPTLPYINTNQDTFAPQSQEDKEDVCPSSGSSEPPGGHSTTASPISNASTGATSLTLSSPRSTKSVDDRRKGKDCLTKSKSISGNADDSILPPIEEDNGRYLLIPVQEAPIEATPSVATVETTAAAKVFLETHFNALLTEPISPRSLRRKKFEKKMSEAGLSHDERLQARQQWIQAESDHLRQIRALKASSLARHEIKGISIAGYEVVRVLGKGSFGVVRLVIERPTNGTHESSGSEPDNSSRHTSSFDSKSGKARRSIKRGQSLKDVYAMKVIRKSDMLRNCQEGHLRAERDFLVASEGSRWVVPLIASFQDNTNLYLVMEYMIGGDFLGLLLREDVLEESVARWYIAEMILCIEEAHKMKWIHRDVKPDNFLICASGHLKISDFGLAFDGHWAHSQSYYSNHRYNLLEKLGIKVDGDEIDMEEAWEVSAEDTGELQANKSKAKRDVEESAKREGLLNWRNRTERRKLARSVVGTSQYMAPEVIMGQPYDGRCDWWSIGIILYEVGCLRRSD